MLDFRCKESHMRKKKSEKTALYRTEEREDTERLGDNKETQKKERLNSPPETAGNPHPRRGGKREAIVQERKTMIRRPQRGKEHSKEEFKKLNTTLK